MFDRIKELQKIHWMARHAGYQWRMFRNTNFGTGGDKALEAHNEFVTKYNEKKYWFQRKLQKIGE